MYTYKSQTTNMIKTDMSVLEYLQSRENVPISIKSIGKKLKIKNRAVFAICMEDYKIKKVHPSHVGCGRTESNIFVVSDDNKWVKCRELISDGEL